MKFNKLNIVGGFQPSDGTIDFYLRIRSLVNAKSAVVDLGAGRAAWFEDDECSVRRDTRYLKPLVGSVIAIDVDPAVLENSSSTVNKIYDGVRLPMEDCSVDLIVADYVLEHIDSVADFVSEVDRVLKPGGYFCARTPHKYNYVAIAARLINNRQHKAVLKRVQPDRKEEDVFPTRYLLNSVTDIGLSFRGWENQTFIFRGEPSYYFGSQSLLWVLTMLHRMFPSILIGNLFVFVRKQG